MTAEITVLQDGRHNARGKRKRRFGWDEDALLTRDFLAYVPTVEIARKLDRDDGTVKQRILHLRLRRSLAVSKALAWAPEHLKPMLASGNAEAFLEACYRWREEKQLALAQLSDEARLEDAARLTGEAAQIDARHDLTRNDKIVAKRMIGMTLEAVGKQHGITRERVRQLTSAAYLVEKHQHGKSVQRLSDKIAQLDARKTDLVRKQLTTLLIVYRDLSDEARELFLKAIGKADSLAGGA